MALSVYQRDYKAYKHDNIKPKVWEELIKRDRIDITNEKEANAIAKAKELQSKLNESAEWTRTSILGQLLEPNVIPPEVRFESIDKETANKKYQCSSKQSSELMDVIKSNYPCYCNTWLKAKTTATEKRKCLEALETTYNTEYSKVKKYCKNDNEQFVIYTKKLNPSKEIQIAEQNIIQKHDLSYLDEPCVQPTKPIKLKVTEIDEEPSYKIVPNINIFQQHPFYTEYTGTISKIGCLIIKNKLLDHNKCDFVNCKHRIRRPCEKF